MTDTVVLVHAATTWFLTGLIWMVQIVHYPLFSRVGTEAFVAYEAAHSSRITVLLLVPWALQGLTTAALLLAPPAGVPRWMVWSAAGLAAVPVVVTIALSVPAHTVLGAGFDAAAHGRLTATNWLRTGAWTAHAVLVLPLLVLALGRAR